MSKILIVEDDLSIQALLHDFIEEAGHSIVLASDGVEALAKYAEQPFDLILLDIMLPKIDGYSVCECIRQKSDVPIIMLTALDSEENQIKGLDLQADDYITKPFNILEVKARIKAIMRRTSPKPKKEENLKIVENGDLRLDCESRRLFILGNEINVTAREFDLLAILVLNPNKVYSREKLLNLVWGSEYPGDVRTVDVHVRRLREKIEEKPSDPKYVHTKWGVGYYYHG